DCQRLQLRSQSGRAFWIRPPDRGRNCGRRVERSLDAVALPGKGKGARNGRQRLASSGAPEDGQQLASDSSRRLGHEGAGRRYRQGLDIRRFGWKSAQRSCSLAEVLAVKSALAAPILKL